MTWDMEENYKQLLMEIARILQKKYNCMTEICRLTEESAQALGRNDKVSVQMLLGMRGEEIEKVRECDKNINLFKESAPVEFSGWLEKALEGKEPVNEVPYGKEGAIVLKIAGNVRSVWEKTMTVDKHMNTRLAGKDSFYSNK